MLQRLKSNQFIWNSLVLFFGTVLVNVLNYLLHLIVGRMVTAEAYGEIESLISLLTIVSVPAAAIGIIATKYSAKMKLSDDETGTHTVFRYLNRKIFLFGIPLLLLAFAATPALRGFLNMESSLPLLFIWALMFLSFLGAVSNGVLSGWQRFAALNVVGVWSALVKFVLGVALIRLGFLVNGAIGSFLAAGAVGYGISLLYLRFIFKAKVLSNDAHAALSHVDTDAIKKSVIPTFIGMLAITMLGNVDMIFAKHALDPVVSGEYSALSVVAKTIFFVTGVITSVLFAMTAGDAEKTEASMRTFKQATMLTVVIGFGSVMFFALFPRFSLGIFFGDKYLNVSHFLALFACMAALYSLANLFLQYLISLHQMRVMIWFLAIAILEVLAFYLYGNSLYDIIALTVSAQVIAVLTGVFFIRRAFRHS